MIAVGLIVIVVASFVAGYNWRRFEEAKQHHKEWRDYLHGKQD